MYIILRNINNGLDSSSSSWGRRYNIILFNVVIKNNNNINPRMYSEYYPVNLQRPSHIVLF